METVVCFFMLVYLLNNIFPMPAAFDKKESSPCPLNCVIFLGLLFPCLFPLFSPSFFFPSFFPLCSPLYLAFFTHLPTRNPELQKVQPLSKHSLERRKSHEHSGKEGPCKNNKAFIIFMLERLKSEREMERKVVLKTPGTNQIYTCTIRYVEK